MVLFTTGCFKDYAETNNNRNSIVKNPTNENKETNKSKKDNTSKSGQDDKNNIDKEQEISLDLFLPKGNYRVQYIGTDMASNPLYVKGNGVKYQVIGASPKCPYINVYAIKEEKLYKIHSQDLTDKQFRDYKNINYLNKEIDTSQEIMLASPLKVGTRWDNKEIVEMGKNLSIEGLNLNGIYIKIWERKDNIIKISYYCEGMGCVKYKILLDDEVVEESTIKSFEDN